MTYQRPIPLAPDDPRHGTASGYIRHRCRCQPCHEAERAYYRDRALVDEPKTNETRRDLFLLHGGVLP